MLKSFKIFFLSLFFCANVGSIATPPKNKSLFLFGILASAVVALALFNMGDPISLLLIFLLVFSGEFFLYWILLDARLKLYNKNNKTNDVLFFLLPIMPFYLILIPVCILPILCGEMVSFIMIALTIWIFCFEFYIFKSALQLSFWKTFLNYFMFKLYTTFIFLLIILVLIAYTMSHHNKLAQTSVTPQNSNTNLLLLSS